MAACSQPTIGGRHTDEPSRNRGTRGDGASRGLPPEQWPYLVRKYAWVRGSDGGIQGVGPGGGCTNELPALRAAEESPTQTPESGVAVEPHPTDPIQVGNTWDTVWFGSGSGGGRAHTDLELDRRGIVVVVGDGIDVAGHRQNGGRRAGDGPRTSVERESGGEFRREAVGQWRFPSLAAGSDRWTGVRPSKSGSEPVPRTTAAGPPHRARTGSQHGSSRTRPTGPSPRPTSPTARRFRLMRPLHLWSRFLSAPDTWRSFHDRSVPLIGRTKHRRVSAIHLLWSMPGGGGAGHRPFVRRGPRPAHTAGPARDRGTRGDGRADAAEHGHTPGPTEAPRREAVRPSLRPTRRVDIRYKVPRPTISLDSLLREGE